MDVSGATSASHRTTFSAGHVLAHRRRPRPRRPGRSRSCGSIAAHAQDQRGWAASSRPVEPVTDCHVWWCGPLLRYSRARVLGPGRAAVRHHRGPLIVGESLSLIAVIPAVLVVAQGVMAGVSRLEVDERGVRRRDELGRSQTCTWPEVQAVELRDNTGWRRTLGGDHSVVVIDEAGGVVPLTAPVWPTDLRAARKAVVMRAKAAAFRWSTHVLLQTAVHEGTRRVGPPPGPTRNAMWPSRHQVRTPICNRSGNLSR